MGDHFVLLVDRLLTESTLEAAIESKSWSQQPTISKSQDNMISSHKIDVNMRSPCKLVECRICHDEDEASNMETPCSCCGSLKYAHRKCVQRWCNEKGDTICEICRQQFRPGYTAPPPLFHYGGIPMNFRGNWEVSRRDLHNPGYTAPPPLFHYGGIPMNFRGNWEVSRRDLHNPGFIAMVSAERDYMDTDFDEYAAPSSRSLICCRIVAIIFMVLLVLRHTLPIIISGAGEYSMTLFTLLMLRTIGILLPVYIMVKAFTAIQRRRHRQDSHLPLATSDEENDSPLPQPRFIQIR